MPLVVPGLQSKDGNNNNDDWMSKLMGKKLGEQHDEMVRLSVSPASSSPLDCTVVQISNVCQTFAKQDLPKEHRVLKPDSMSTMDHKPERLNIHVDDDGTVKNVRYG
jgi:hypothetical protein